MSAERKYRNQYLDGTAARQLDVVPDYETVRKQQREEFEKRQRERNRKARQRAQRNKGIDLFSMLFLTVALGITMFVTVSYIQAQIQMTRIDKRIASLQSTLLSMADENAAIKDSTNKELDLAKVYEVATQTLGMVHPMENQVITYESSINDYVKQFDNIPDVSSNKLSDIFGK